MENRERGFGRLLRRGSPEMAERGRNLTTEIIAILFLCCVAVEGENVTVSYDQRALLLDGQRRLLISAGIHYPRASPEMWPHLIAKAKEGGANVIQTYVFWSGHEPQKGEYNFDGRYDLPKFVKLVGEAGLYLNLRIGPYVCAEWNFGGFPTWLRDVPGIEFRTDNQQFKDEMGKFVQIIVELMKELELFAWQGGPIILAQIENEYGNIEWEYGQPGKQYVKWAANFAESLQTRVPWIMCQQNDAPANVIDTCNGFYCDGFKPNAPGRPTMWTEDWNGWFNTWGSTVRHRPVEDNAFAVARFYQRGGSFQNYYMYFGGTNFGRTAGGPFLTTSYDYDAPLDEFGLVRQPKWGHLKELHAVLMLCESALMAVDGEPEYIWLGPNQEAHVYSSSPGETSDIGDLTVETTCAAFLANIDSKSSAIVEFRGRHYELPAWSVSILADCKNVAFNTAQISTQRSVMSMKRHPQQLRNSEPSHLVSGNDGQYDESSDIAINGLEWELQYEPVGIRNGEAITAQFLLEQLNTTKDLTDYMWYTTRFQVSQGDAGLLSIGTGQAHLTLEAVRDALHIFVNGELVGSATGSWFRVDQVVSLHEGTNEIALLVMTVGLQNYGAFLEKDGAGIRGSVQLRGLPSGDLDLTTTEWVHQVGLKGEDLGLFTNTGAASASWVPTTFPRFDRPLTWYKTKFSAPDGQDPVALDLGGMGKGQVWVNGHHLGRYWSLLAPSKGCSDVCDYRGAFHSEKCVSNCGQFTQRWYHVPREWLREDENLLVLFEEIGGDLTTVSIATRFRDTICAHVSESYPPPVQKWVQFSKARTEDSQEVLSPEVKLECATGQKISEIVFASFGTSSGICGGFLKGACHAPNSHRVVEKACLGQRSCFIALSSNNFGEDPCPGRPKSLTVQAVCRGSGDGNAEILRDSEYVPTAKYSNKWQRNGGSNMNRQERPFLLSSDM